MSATTHQAFNASNDAGLSPLQPPETHQEAQPAAARLVPEDERMTFLPQLFGPRVFFHGESAVYGWMRKLCKAYTGGLWQFFRVGDAGAGFMAPDIEGPLKLYVDGNGFEGDMSTEAAGIVVTLFALNHLMFSTPDKGAVDLLCDRYEELRDFAREHAEARAIFAAID
jgi:hypothetical protein